MCRQNKAAEKSISTIQEGGFIISSSNKTANADLNLWDANDPVLREDFNSDNIKIDALLAAAPMVKLFDIITSGDSYQIDIDVSDIDLYKYSRLELQLEMFTSYTSAATNMYLRLNSLNSSYITSSLTSSNASSSTYFASAITPYNSNLGMSVAQLHLRPETGTRGAIVYLDYRYFSNGQAGSASHGTKLFTSLSDIKTINVIINATDRSFSAGSRITVYGVKR